MKRILGVVFGHWWLWFVVIAAISWIENDPRLRMLAFLMSIPSALAALWILTESATIALMKRPDEDASI